MPADLSDAISVGITTADAVLGAAGLLVVMLICGVAVLVLAEQRLIAVARMAARDISLSFWTGVLFQIFALPALIMVVAVCAITLVGIFAIPFVIIAWTLVVAGALTLGFLGVAYLIGRALVSSAGGEQRRRAEIKAILVGLSLIGALWIIAALVVSVPWVGVLVRLIAVALTWAVTTVGVGAVVRSRNGSIFRRWRKTPEPTLPLWQTPTPVTGVVAAVRVSSTDKTTSDL